MEANLPFRPKAAQGPNLGPAERTVKPTGRKQQFKTYLEDLEVRERFLLARDARQKEQVKLWQARNPSFSQIPRSWKAGVQKKVLRIVQEKLEGRGGRNLSESEFMAMRLEAEQELQDQAIAIKHAVSQAPLPPDLAPSVLAQNHPSIFTAFQSSPVVQSRALRTHSTLLNRLIWFSGLDATHNFSSVYSQHRYDTNPFFRAVADGAFFSAVKEAMYNECLYFCACCEADRTPTVFALREKYVKLWLEPETEAEISDDEAEAIKGLVRVNLAKIKAEVREEEKREAKLQVKREKRAAKRERRRRKRAVREARAFEVEQEKLKKRVKALNVEQEKLRRRCEKFQVSMLLGQNVGGSAIQSLEDVTVKQEDT